MGSIFDPDKVCPKGLPFSQVKPAGTSQHTQFANSIDTDGVMTSLLIHRPTAILCPHCTSANNDANALIWDRDINAGVNMRRILTAYSNSGYQIGSRTAALCRPSSTEDVMGGQSAANQLL
ncbi:uncharacterized protein BYT42DRAFT_614143 [Radiomyces spectabilis]|uniref:uncharacterized protein n=1 Tax=Radiomyces spectabilis TaxID=64574 RepID=UPI00221E5A32|nr:uncharacterized protein BYT42DRAFT_614143 [Radiomyces spectabilis]KAI8377459.1 hypothetical protein BYT42DRAFT_614143 [Radiomyces spectabilis]